MVLCIAQAGLKLSVAGGDNNSWTYGSETLGLPRLFLPPALSLDLHCNLHNPNMRVIHIFHQEYRKLYETFNFTSLDILREIKWVSILLPPLF